MNRSGTRWNDMHPTWDGGENEIVWHGRTTDRLSEDVGSTPALMLWSFLTSLSYLSRHIHVNAFIWTVDVNPWTSEMNTERWNLAIIHIITHPRTNQQPWNNFCVSGDAEGVEKHRKMHFFELETESSVGTRMDSEGLREIELRCSSFVTDPLFSIKFWRYYMSLTQSGLELKRRHKYGRSLN